MNTAVTIVLIICATLIFFAVLGFISGRESKEIQKSELELKKFEAIERQLAVIEKLPSEYRDSIFKEIGEQ